MKAIPNPLKIKTCVVACWVIPTLVVGYWVGAASEKKYQRAKFQRYIGRYEEGFHQEFEVYQVEKAKLRVESHRLEERIIALEKMLRKSEVN
jgi:hypothetical protein